MGGFISRPKPAPVPRPEPKPEPKPIVETKMEKKYDDKKRIWRNVPSRSWQATHAKGKLSSSKEVLLLHKPNGKAVLN